MHAPPISSPPSAPCRLEWRPSCWLLAALAVLYAAWLLRREARREPRALLLPAQGSVAASVDGQPVAALQVDWRGPLAFVRWRDADGRAGRLAWWPDTLPPPARRELRLAAQARAASSAPPQMAP